jgi:DNA-binding SARP family transcriptional activator
MGTLRISLFGKLCIRRDQQPVAGLEVIKAQELLCFLLLHRDRPHPRERLAHLLWGDRSTPQSKRYLRKSLWQIQTALNSQTGSSDRHLLLVEPGWVQLNLEAEFWLDVSVFEKAFNLVYRRPGRDLTPQCVETLSDVVGLYQGDLLEGWYHDWCLHERQRLQHMYLAMLDKLMGFCEAYEKYEDGLIFGSTILRYDRAREHTHRRLMRLHYLAGNRTAALRQYEHCVAILKEELGVRPARSTVALHRQIRADQLHDAALHSTGEHTLPEIATVERIVGCLKSVVDTLVDLQRQAQQALELVEMAASRRQEE